MKTWLFFLFFSANSIIAQVKQKETATVYLNYPDYSVKVNVLNSAKSLQPNPYLTYYWYSANRIMATQGGYDGKILDGLYTSFYLSNNLKEKGIFKNGLKTGEWITWYENGKIHEVTGWKKGLKTGVSKIFNNEGILIKEANFKYGQLNGCQVSYDNGKIVDKKIFKKGLEVKKDSIHENDREKKNLIKEEKTNEGKAEELNKGKSTEPKPAVEKKKKEKVKKAKVKKAKKIKNKEAAPKVENATPKTKTPFKDKLRAVFKKKDKSPKSPETKSETK